MPVPLALTAVLIGALFPLEVHAQTCALLPPGEPENGRSAPPEAQAAAIDAVTEALTRDGLVVMASADAQRRMIGEPFAECNALDCGGSVVRSLGVDFAVLVTVWAPAGTPTSVVVTFIGADGTAAGDAPVDGDVARATLAALATARQRWQASQMGFLEVRTTPPGAAVEVDGRVLGESPLRRMTMAGPRRVRLHLEGYQTVERIVDITPTEVRAVEVTMVEPVDLTPEPEPEPEPVTTAEPHFANWILGGALAAGGLASLTVGLVNAGLNGQCQTQGLTGCQERYAFDPVRDGILLGVGGALLVSGVVLFITAPFEVHVSASPEGARLQLEGSF